MKYHGEFLDKVDRLGVHRTKSECGKGVRCNIALYMYPDGHGNFYLMKDSGAWITHKNKELSSPSNNLLETVDIFIDILYVMYKRAKKIRPR
jgi:hypothetical protein